MIANHVIQSCDCGNFSVVYICVDHINTLWSSSPIMHLNTRLGHMETQMELEIVEQYSPSHQLRRILVIGVMVRWVQQPLTTNHSLSWVHQQNHTGTCSAPLCTTAYLQFCWCLLCTALSHTNMYYCIPKLEGKTSNSEQRWVGSTVLIKIVKLFLQSSGKGGKLVNGRGKLPSRPPLGLQWGFTLP